jgi:hypothetical protein
MRQTPDVNSHQLLSSAQLGPKVGSAAAKAFGLHNRGNSYDFGSLPDFFSFTSTRFDLALRQNFHQ